MSGNVTPCIFSTGGGIFPSAKCVTNLITIQLFPNSLDKIEELKHDLRNDFSFSLLISRIDGIITGKKNFFSQLPHLNHIAI